MESSDSNFKVWPILSCVLEKCVRACTNSGGESVFSLLMPPKWLKKFISCFKKICVDRKPLKRHFSGSHDYMETGSTQKSFVNVTDGCQVEVLMSVTLSECQFLLWWTSGFIGLRNKHWSRQCQCQQFQQGIMGKILTRYKLSQLHCSDNLHQLRICHHLSCCSWKHKANICVVMDSPNVSIINTWGSPGYDHVLPKHNQLSLSQLQGVDMNYQSTKKWTPSVNFRQA